MVLQETPYVNQLTAAIKCMEFCQAMASLTYQRCMSQQIEVSFQANCQELQKRILMQFYDTLSGQPYVLRAIACNYGESNDRSENSDFPLLRQKDPFGELFSEICFKSSSEFIFL